MTLTFEEKGMEWTRTLAYIAEAVDESAGHLRSGESSESEAGCLVRSDERSQSNYNKLSSSYSIPQLSAHKGFSSDCKA